MRTLNNFTKTDAKPEDIHENIGVSNRFKDPELKKAVAAQIAGEINIQQSNTSTENADVLAPDIMLDTESERTVTDVLSEIAGDKGFFKIIDRNSLLPTPDEWNKFSSISLEKKVLMADSIYRNGLQQPIVVRQLNEYQYQILAGNTRNEIYGILYDLTNDNKYLSIEAKVYSIDELTDDQAREIASDTNYVQRATLTARDRAFAIQTKIDILKRHKSKSVLEKVAKQMNIKKTSVFYLSKIANIIPQFEIMLNEGKITLKAASRIASWPDYVQHEIYNMHDELTSRIIMKIPAKTPYNEIVPAFKACVAAEKDNNTNRVITATMTIEQDNGSCLIEASEAPSDGFEPVLLYIPKNKLKTLMHNYDGYIVKNRNSI